MVSRGANGQRRRWVAFGLCFALLSLLVPNLYGQSSDLADLDQGFRKLAKRLRPQVVGVQIFERVIPAEDDRAHASIAFEKVKLLTLSGMVWHKDGTVVSILRGGLPEPETDGGEIGLEVVLHDGTTHAATIVAADAYTGVTLLKMSSPPKNLKTVKLPRSLDDSLSVGSMVLALGHEMIHTGLITNLRQRVEIRTEGFAFPRTLRTNIPARAGNSGGMLCDSRGQLLGMLAFELGKSQGANRSRRGGGVHASESSSNADRRRGEVLAIPVDLLARICRSLGKSGSFVRGAIGIEFKPVSFDQLCIGNTSRYAAVITWVHPDGPAAHAGLEIGHVILGVKGGIFRKYEDLSRFTEMVEYGALGDKLNFTYFKYDPDHPALNNILNGTVTIGRRDALPPVRSRDSEAANLDPRGS